MRIVIYGIGRIYQKINKELHSLLDNDEIVALADKNADELQFFENTEIIGIDALKNCKYDYVLVTPLKFAEIKDYLKKNGVPSNCIVNMDMLKLIKKQGRVIYHNKLNVTENKKILLLTSHLGMHGGAIACYYAAKILMKRGYHVDVASGNDADEGMINLLQNIGVGVLLLESYPFVGGEDFNYINIYDCIIGNTITVARAVVNIAQYKPTLWWIHEAEDCLDKGIYYSLKQEYDLEQEKDLIKKIRVLTVSELAQKALQEHYPFIKSSMLCVGINDKINYKAKKRKALTVSIIGDFSKNKNQIGFIKAALKIDNSDTEFWIVGRENDEKYSYDIHKKAATSKSIKIFGEIRRDRMPLIYEDTDIVVCNSYIESLSITVIEGMMNSKICITTEGTGIAKYIKDGVNGFICKAGDVDSLANKMLYVIEHFDELGDIQKRARETYEKYFTLDILGDNLEREIKEAEKLYFNNR